jgi:DNA-directed RNA polymerase specialized sigma24 family protein
MSDTDLELLARYTRCHAEDAFAEIVRRHLDLVHSAALRQVRSPQLAEEVAQATFLKLAGHAHRLAPDTVLSAWLYQVTRREAIDVVRREARRQLREQIATEMNAMNATAADWTHIEPLLDEPCTRSASPIAPPSCRYFENKSLREVGQALGTSDDTAQKRVSRAVERLREFFAKRGVTVGASGLGVVISANAVQAAPVGLAATITTAAALAGTAIATTTTITATKAIAMTALQKALVTVTLTAAVSAGIYEARQAQTCEVKFKHSLSTASAVDRADPAIASSATMQRTTRFAGQRDSQIKGTTLNCRNFAVKCAMGLPTPRAWRNRLFESRLSHCWSG